jgi:phage shock protein PspC (stress-responsive transcriptional regulator)
MQSDNKVLTKSKHGLFSGTLRGLADYYSLNLNGLQFVFLIAAFFGIGLVLYFVLWISIPNYSQRKALLNNLQSKQE